MNLLFFKRKQIADVRLERTIRKPEQIFPHYVFFLIFSFIFSNYIQIIEINDFSLFFPSNFESLSIKHFQLIERKMKFDTNFAHI